MKVSDIELELRNSCWKDGGDIQKVKELLKYPEININGADEGGWSPFIWACLSGNLRIVELLLNHDGIDVNKEDKYGQTAFSLACLNGNTEVVKLMLRHSHVDINLPEFEGWTPLMIAAADERVDIIKWMIASGRKIEKKPKNIFRKTAFDISREYNKIQVLSILKEFEENEEEIRKKLRIELNWELKMASDIFSLIVSVSDDYYGIPKVIPSCPPRIFIKRKTTSKFEDNLSIRWGSVKQKASDFFQLLDVFSFMTEV